MDAYHPHIPFPKSDYFSERTHERTDGRTEFGNLILCAPTYRALRAIIYKIIETLPEDRNTIQPGINITIDHDQS